MPRESDTEAKPFLPVFEAEVAAIDARRRALHRDVSGPWTIAIEPRETRDERGRVVPVPASGSDLVGLALSGGGVRSAAFCLGVLQGLDAVVEDNRQPQVFDAIDYLSTVSGGGYIGTSLVAGLMQTQGKFPFASKLDQSETIETQHIRDYSNYLAPEGAIDWLVGLVVLVRGLLINAMIFMSVILLAALVTVMFNPNQLSLSAPPPDVAGWYPKGFRWTAVMTVLFLLGQLIYAIVAPRLRHYSPTLRQREAFGRLFALALGFYGLVVFLDLQAYILASLFDADLLDQCARCGDRVGALGKALHDFRQSHHGLPSLWKFLVASATATIVFGSKVMNIAKATLGDDTWTGFIKHWGSRLLLYVAAIAVPLLLWATYLEFAYWGIAWKADPALGVRIDPHAPQWLQAIAENAFWPGQYQLVYAVGFAVLFAASLLVKPNANSLHGYYRDRLSRAFLWQRTKLLAEARLRDRRKPSPLVGLLAALHPRRKASDVDTFKLSSLKPLGGGDEPGQDPVAFAPYLLINTAVNLEGSKYLNRRGRNADSFFFSPLYLGSEATGYVRTTAMEALSPEANVATAMAISGAAASANMGASTIRILTFTLAALNVRLGFWLPNPRLLSRWTGWTRRLAAIGPYFFTRETFGQLDEWSENVYLTDGGHFDNLGLYELLKRRCKIVIAVDAEADPPMNFESLVRLQRYVRIDLGVRIDLPWEDLRRFSRTITVDNPHGPHDDPAQCIGPHIALGRIDYGPGDSGVLIYIKACISGDESDLIRDYRRRNATFPHETTLDQFFTEEQFEVYRALGFHATHSFFSGDDRFALLYPEPDPAWAETVRAALLRLHVPHDAIAKIVERQQDGPRWATASGSLAGAGS